MNRVGSDVTALCKGIGISSREIYEILTAPHHDTLKAEFVRTAREHRTVYLWLQADRTVVLFLFGDFFHICDYFFIIFFSFLGS